MNARSALRFLHPRSLKYLSSSLDVLVRGRLWAKVLIGMASGILLGLALGPAAAWVPRATALVIVEWLALPGEIFLRVIQMIVVPLVLASVVRGIAASEDPEQLRKLGARIVIYFLATTTIAILIGVGVASLIRPGERIDTGQAIALVAAGSESRQAPAAPTPPTGAADEPGSIPAQVVRLLPANPLGAMVQAEMLQVVLFAIIIGLALISISSQGAKLILEVLGGVQEVCMAVVRWAMRLAPLAVFGLMTRLTATVGLDALLGVALYAATVLIGLALLLGMYLVMLVVLAGRSPRAFMRAAREVQLLAFSTSSSAAVMPLSLRTAQDELGIRRSVSELIIPLGSTINMDGTALYQAVAAIFLAQIFGIEVGLEGLLLLVVTAVGASIGAPSTPGVGIAILSMVVGSIGVPQAGIALVLGVDRLLDMSRTAINVTGDLTAATIMDRWVGSGATAAEEAVADDLRELERVERGENVVVGD